MVRNKETASDRPIEIKVGPIDYALFLPRLFNHWLKLLFKRKTSSNIFQRHSREMWRKFNDNHTSTMRVGPYTRQRSFSTGATKATKTRRLEDNATFTQRITSGSIMRDTHNWNGNPFREVKRVYNDDGNLTSKVIQGKKGKTTTIYLPPGRWIGKKRQTRN